MTTPTQEYPTTVESQGMHTLQPSTGRPITSRRVTHRRGAGGGLVAALAAWMIFTAISPGWSATPALTGSFAPRLSAPTEAAPPLPPLADFPVQLVLDDDIRDGDFGFAGPPARNFLWFNRFAAPAPGFVLKEIWVLFSPGPNMAVGGAIQLAVYLDPDGDPATGAELLATFNETIQVLDGDTFSVYSLATPVSVAAAGDLLIGVVMRGGVMPPPAPAAIDTTASAASSWVAIWSTDPPDPPLLAPPGDPDNLLDLVDNVGTAGNWMIRGFGTTQPAVVIPTLDSVGLVLLFLLLAAAALFVMRRSGRSLGTLGLLLLAFLASPPASAVVVDDFSTLQLPLTVPPDAASTVGGAGVLGTNRDLTASRLSGPGAVATSVGGGQFTFIADPDTRGEAVLSWDGDSDPAILDPTGLGGLDLTAGSATTFRLRVEGTTAGMELLMEVFSDGANSSRAALVLPAIGAAADVHMAFLGFQPVLGAGADFANVGAIVLTVRDTGSNLAAAQLDVSLVDTVAPAVAATKVDTLLSAAPAEPGDIVEYTIEIDNTGGAATGVTVADLIAANPDLTLVAGSLETTPIVLNEQYEACGNVTISVDGSPGFPGLLANDTDPDGNNGMPLTIVTFDAVTAKGGTVSNVDINTGTFDYDPPPGFTGLDSFNYLVGDQGGNLVAGTATLILAETVWFVDNSQPGTSLGTLANPFHTLAEAEAASVAGDTIFIFEGLSPVVTGLDAGITLKEGQRLIGHGVDLVACGTTIVAASTRPHITHAGGNGINLTGSHEIRGLNIVASAGAGLFGNAVGTVTVSDTSIIDAGGAAIDIDGGDLAMSFDLIDSLASGSHGIRLHNVTGTLTSTTTQIDNPTDFGISVLNSPAAVLSFGVTGVTLAGDTVAGSDPAVMVNNNVGGTVRFASLSVSTENGAGIVTNMGGTVDIQDTTGVVNAVGGAALDLANTTLRTGATPGWTFASLNSTNSGQQGVRLSMLNDPVTVTTGTTVMDATGSGILVANSPATAFDFGATMVSDTNLGAAPMADGVDLATGNAGSTFTFDSLAVVADGGDGLKANNSGTVNIGGTGNSMTATGGAALDLTATSLGTGATFVGLNSTGGTTGVNLVNVPGGVAVAGPTVVLSSGAGINLSASGTFATTTLDVTTTAGPGLIANGTGTVSVTTAAGSQILATGGPAVDLTNTNLAIALATLSSTGTATTGVNLVGASGTLSANGGNVTGSAGGAAFNVNGGSAVVSYGGSVTENSAQRVVNIENTTGGSVTFQTGTVTGGPASLGVLINNADGNVSFADLDLGTNGAPMTHAGLTLTGGSTGTFAFAGTQIFTTGAAGVNGDNGGVVEFTGAGNRVSTTSARALTFANGTTIGANGVTLERIDASGADLGIFLSSAGSGFTVTGVGTTNGSGGTIQNTTQNGILVESTNTLALSNMNLSNAANDGGGAGNCSGTVFTNCNAALELTTVSTVDLVNLNITGFEDHGIFGQTVTDLDISNTTITGLGADVDTDEHAIFVRDLLGTVAAGTDSLFDNLTLADAQDTAIFIQNSTATSPGNATNPDQLSVTNSALSNAGDSGLNVQTVAANGNLKLIATGNTITNTVDGVSVVAVAGDMQATVGGAGALSNVISAGAGGNLVKGILFFANAATGASTVDAIATNNTITLDAVKIGGVAPVSGLSGIGVSSGGASSGNLGTIRATVSGNTVNSSFAGIATQTVHGIITTNEGTGTTSQNVIEISNNTITLNPVAGTPPNPDPETVGIGVDGGPTGGGTTVRITGNTIAANGDATNGASVGIQILPTELGDPVNTNTRVCVRVTGNTVSTPNNPFAAAFGTTELDVIAAPVAVGSFLDVEAIALGVRTPAQIKSDLEPLNTSTEVGDATGSVGGTITGVALCPN